MALERKHDFIHNLKIPHRCGLWDHSLIDVILKVQIYQLRIPMIQRKEEK